MLVACVQTDVTFGDLETNLNRVRDWLKKAEQQNVELVVFPECMLSGYGYNDRDSAYQNALDVEDHVFGELTKLAAQSPLYFTLGFLQRQQEKLYNAAALIGPEGLVGLYQKVHLPHLGVDRFVDRGEIPYRTLTANEAQVGLAICYDSSFPEPMRVLGLAGADIIALGTNWPVAAKRTAEIVPPARSMENHLFFLAANRVGAENGFEFCGCSSIHGPDGVVLAKTDSDRELMLVADVDLAQARNKRIERTEGLHVIDRFGDRCPEFYRGITD